MFNKDKSTGDKFTDSISFRILVIGFLILILLIPLASVRNLIHERKARSESVIAEVSSKWGQAQTIIGPVLTIPYNKSVESYNNKKQVFESKIITEYLHLLPGIINYECNLEPEERYRGIFKVVVYKSYVQSNGVFELPELSKLDLEKSDIQWDNVQISFRLSDFRSLQDDIDLIFDGNKCNFESGSTLGLSNGVSVNILLDSNKNEWNFDLNLGFYGSSDLKFTPLGKTTNVSIKSSWINPSFIGGFLPDQREITDDGFNASWKILHLNRPIKQLYFECNFIPLIHDYDFGVNLYLPIDHYQKSERSIKYAILLISLTFITFFSVSVINKVKIHPIQYLLIGFAICVFYSLLISISEQLGFDIAYWISAASIIILLSIYSKAIIKNMKFTLSLGGVILLLYGFIFVIIQLQDYSLLVGSIGLFIVVSTLMYLSIKLKILK